MYIYTQVLHVYIDYKSNISQLYSYSIHILFYIVYVAIVLQLVGKNSRGSIFAEIHISVKILSSCGIVFEKMNVL